jgi:hypothetical protein
VLRARAARDDALSGGMADRATPQTCRRATLSATARFYGALGFEESWRDNGWMILERGDLTLEFFPHPKLKPRTSWFSCCLRLDDLDAFYAVCVAAGISEACRGLPRLHPPAWKIRACGSARSSTPMAR